VSGGVPVLPTGASGRLGRGLARRLGAAGITLRLTDILGGTFASLGARRMRDG